MTSSPPNCFSQHHLRLNLPTAMTITICGGGHSATTAAAYLGSKPGLAVNVLTRQPSRWNKEILLTTQNTSWEKKGDIWGLLNIVTDDPIQVIPFTDLIIIASPSHSHPDILKKIAPHLKKGGFDWAFKSCLGSNLHQLDGVWGLFNIPWICNCPEYGRRALLIGPKEKLRLCSYPIEKASEFARLAELLFDMPCELAPNFLSLTLTPSNQIIHPARYYSIFRDWDGKTPYPKEKIPFGLYSEFDDLAAEWLQKLDNELQAIKTGLTSRYPNLDLSCVLPIGERIIAQYGDSVKDRSSLKMIFRSNRGYTGTVTPTAMSPDGSGYIPKIDSRLFWEDIPFGLCILKSIATMLEQETPSIDTMIFWHQEFMGKEYLLPDKTLNKNLLKQTAAPEAYGIFTLDDLVASSLPNPSMKSKL